MFCIRKLTRSEWLNPSQIYYASNIVMTALTGMKRQDGHQRALIAGDDFHFLNSAIHELCLGVDIVCLLHLVEAGWMGCQPTNPTRN